MGVHPHTTIISEAVFKRPECPKNFAEYVKDIGYDIKIGDKTFYIISWCEHYMSGEWDDLEYDEDKDEFDELKDYTDEYSDEFSSRVYNWLDSLQALREELVF